ncbi:MAG: helix-turn-helix transcriptional regulator [Pseudomonas sp.]|nr:helix-turn-helix transcriptional regulator [Pseudomonas sp.]HBS81039.1 helix-turn-helix transcriptional regulator [Pseudomonas sp.]|tara:strand:+ start:6682 stop:7059 length:378 start_codon:yes stop_codon:yes gene_type:complete
MDVFTHGNWQGFFNHGLSEREVECTVLAAGGMTNKEIAKAMGIAPDTVKKRIQCAMDRLDVHRRAGLVAEAMRKAIIAPLVLLLAICEVAPHQQVQTRPVRTPTAMKRVVRIGRELSQPLMLVAA